MRQPEAGSRGAWNCYAMNFNDDGRRQWETERTMLPVPDSMPHRQEQPIQSYRDLVAWQKAFALEGACYRASRAFPDDERYGLTSQLRRAAASVAANIAEGNGRMSRGDYVRYLRIAHASLRETENHLLRAADSGYLDADSSAGLLALASDVGRLLGALIRSLSTKG